MPFYLVERADGGFEYDSVESVVVRAATPDEALDVARTNLGPDDWWDAYDKAMVPPLRVTEIGTEGTAEVVHVSRLHG